MENQEEIEEIPNEEQEEESVDKADENKKSNVGVNNAKSKSTRKLRSMKSLTKCIECEEHLETQTGNIYYCVICGAPVHEPCFMLADTKDEDDNFYCKKHFGDAKAKKINEKIIEDISSFFEKSLNAENNEKQKRKNKNPAKENHIVCYWNH